ncbi:hypothetical protein NLI96_g911 [Meripilus lineatus]|uniref:Major facilitator superfamily (MFS) profile domain-containing protein n=1 Tax=Meripilus lineatus TaxID=2056292 RepID=A0AAD5VBT3_9APHY|nr:hypothetical protein NLI96_g911 [Physisporinus lineatus]
MSFPANDLEKSDPHADDLAVVSSPSTGCADKPDIEHSLVSDDPRQWSRGCKKVYLISLVICSVGCIISATAQSIGVLIGMRCVQALGSSAVLAIGAATLADIYEPYERGTMMGIYYSAPLLGPAIGPIIGGALTQAFGWRATFWFLLIFTSVCFTAFIFFKDTFRPERSLTYQTVLKRVIRHAAEEAELNCHKSETSSLSQTSTICVDAGVEVKKVSIPTTTFVEAVEKRAEGRKKENDSLKNIRLSLKDANPAPVILILLSRPNNLIILVASGLDFAFTYSISYTCSRTLSEVYHFDALRVGLTLLAFGAGSICGSILGGRWSDFVLAHLKAKNGGVGSPEMRLQSPQVCMLFFPACVIAYGWLSEKHVHIAVICVMLFLCGFFQICIYASTLAYVVDANVGRSSSAVAINSAFRGSLAFMSAEIAVPLQVSIGDGGLYCIWTGLLVFAECLILLVWWKGTAWREKAEKREERIEDRSSSPLITNIDSNNLTFSNSKGGPSGVFSPWEPVHPSSQSIPERQQTAVKGAVNTAGFAIHFGGPGAAKEIAQQLEPNNRRPWCDPSGGVAEKTRKMQLEEGKISPWSTSQASSFTITGSGDRHCAVRLVVLSEGMRTLKEIERQGGNLEASGV